MCQWHPESGSASLLAVAEVSNQLQRLNGWKTTSLCLFFSSQTSVGMRPHKRSRQRAQGLEGQLVYNYLVEQQQDDNYYCKAVLLLLPEIISLQGAINKSLGLSNQNLSVI